MTFPAARDFLQAPGAALMIRPHAFTPKPETACGSVRCMIAGAHLSPRPVPISAGAAK